jgi:hypothetical protein
MAGLHCEHVEALEAKASMEAEPETKEAEAIHSKAQYDAKMVQKLLLVLWDVDKIGAARLESE